MTAAKLRCAVIGGGIMGAAAAYALARRGAAVTLFEQFALGHDCGSSHGPTRLFRTAYFEHPDYVPLLKRAAAGWRALETESGASLLAMTGVFMAGAAQSALIEGTLRAAEEHRLPIERLPRAQANSRFPWVCLDAHMETLIEPEAGFIYADRAIAAFLSGARTHGANIMDRTPIRGWRKNGAQIEITTEMERLKFDRMIAAPGAFAAALLGEPGALVRPMRKALFWTSPGDDRLTVERGFLPFGIEEDDGRFFYGFSAIDSGGVKVGEHTGGAFVSSPEDDAPEAASTARADIEAFLARRAPGLSPHISKQQSCLYEMSPDGHFIIDTHPDCDSVVFAIGHSGHGFKFAPVIGEALADLAIKGETLRDFCFLTLARFEE